MTITSGEQRILDQGMIGGLPSPLSPSNSIEDIHILYYRHGNDPRTQVMHFKYPGDFKSAIARGRNFCERVGYRFIQVRKFLVNLDELERRSGDGSQVG